MGAERDSIREVWGTRTPTADGQWPERVDQHLEAEPTEWVQSACVLCSNGCGMDIGVRDGRIVGVRGRQVDRVNKGRLGPKGLHGWVANHSPDRLTTPLIRRDGKLQAASWDEAMDLIVSKSRELTQEHTSLSMGFYTTGQLFLEEYYTLSTITDAGLGTPNEDGNTRLCTATAAAALMESFGADGDPGSYEDFDVTNAFFLVGHNLASQQTVLWMRLLDRLESGNRPRLIVVDPRLTDTAREADVHLDVRVGTNVALLNGLQHLLIERGWVDQQFVNAHTVGFSKLQETVAKYTPDVVSQICGIAAGKIEAAAEILGTAPTLVSTCLQGVYQSNQATAAACQVNNINLLRGMIGKPGCSVFQMNGQPTAQNTRETGCDGAWPAFRNYANPEHVKQQAEHWNVLPEQLPAWYLPTHIMQILRHCETGSIKFLWINGTNPAVSLPQLHRVREILAKPELFVVVQDAFLTETTEFADVVLPAAIWGEKTGCFTNADRTVHISRKAVEPPGEARSDFDIFVDYARRMDFRDKDGQPLVKWSKPEEAFDHFKIATRGRPCDYSGASYAKLSEGSGLQWPITTEAPDGTPRLYTDFHFSTDPDYCETYGHDLATGGAITAELYKASDPRGKAFLKHAEYQPPHEQPDEDFPFWLTTGRVVYHFHTRTKTGRSRELQEAAPEVFVEISAEDAEALGYEDGELVAVETRRGRVVAPVRISGIKRGHLFIPFHYGYWDAPDQEHHRAANELTLTEWDPVSKQPHFKYAAARLARPDEGPIARAVETIREAVGNVAGASGKE